MKYNKIEKNGEKKLPKGKTLRKISNRKFVTSILYLTYHTHYFDENKSSPSSSPYFWSDPGM